MIIRQIVKLAADNDIQFEIEGDDLTAPVPHAGDIIHWKKSGTSYTAKVQSKTFAYDRDEVSIAQTNDWGLTITINVDIIEAA